MDHIKLDLTRQSKTVVILLVQYVYLSVHYVRYNEQIQAVSSSLVITSMVSLYELLPRWHLKESRIGYEM